MPDVLRERRDRQTHRLDTRVVFTFVSGRWVNGEWVESNTTMTTWGRREDPRSAIELSVGPDGKRIVGAVVILMRFDARITAGHRFTMDGLDHIVRDVEPVGRRRYLLVTGDPQTR